MKQTYVFIKTVLSLLCVCEICGWENLNIYSWGHALLFQKYISLLQILFETFFVKSENKGFLCFMYKSQK